MDIQQRADKLLITLNDLLKDDSPMNNTIDKAFFSRYTSYSPSMVSGDLFLITSFHADNSIFTSTPYFYFMYSLLIEYKSELVSIPTFTEIRSSNISIDAIEAYVKRVTSDLLMDIIDG